MASRDGNTYSPLIGVLVVLWLALGLFLYPYDLWRDWQHHEFHWPHVAALLVYLCLLVSAVRWVRRDLRKRRGNAAADQTSPRACYEPVTALA